MKKLFLFIIAIALYSCSNDSTEEQSVKTASFNEEIHVCTALNSDEELSNQTGRVSYKGKYWQNGQTISIKFLNGDTFLQNKVKWFATCWLSYANVKFVWVASNQNADIKIAFRWNGDTGSWSTIGTDAKIRAQNFPSMNFGWFDAKTTDEEFSRTVMHEFGHALGLAHEHLSPVSPIQWNKPVVYAEYEKSGWTKADVDNNFFNKLTTTQADYTSFDIKSIMLYSFPASFTLNNYATPLNTVLSDEDKKSIAVLYPGITPVVSTLNPNESLNIGNSLYSNNRRFWLVMQTDGNLVIYDLINGDQKAIWNTITHGNPGATVTMQADGNLVVYKNGKALWNSLTDKNPGAYLAMQDDGNLVIYLNGKALWSSKFGRTY